MLPILRDFAANDTVAWWGGTPITAAVFCNAAARLALRLPRARFAFNLCDSGDNFLLASAAALLAGQTLLLPPMRLARSLDELERLYADSYCLVDHSAAATSAAGEQGFFVDAVSEAAPGGHTWPPPSVPANHNAAVLFTSGSTGTPQPQAKTWVALVGGAQTLLRSFGSPRKSDVIVGTVAPQHMFGFETTVMLPLQSGTAVLDARPVFPADLADVLARHATGATLAWLMTTPLQLQAFHRGLASLRGLRQIITATMPLDRALALAVERDWKVPVREIFGSTEGGILATRRPAESSEWTAASGLTFSVSDDDKARVAGGHLPATLVLTDRIRLIESTADGGPQRLELLGREEDVVKIAGKRASLAGLHRLVLSIDGVTDAAVFLPRPDAARLAAIVVAPGLTVAALRAELARRIDAVFVPRPLLLADRLPRDANTKLPLSALHEMLRRADARGDASILPRLLEREWSVPVDHPSLPGHFPGHPVVPGVVILDAVEAMFTERGRLVRECVQAKFLAPVLPAAALSLRVEIVDAGTARFSVDAGGRAVVKGVLRYGRSEISP